MDRKLFVELDNPVIRARGSVTHLDIKFVQVVFVMDGVPIG